MPPTISVPKGRAVVTVREGSPAELQCEVRGKPRPPVLWSRVDKEAALLPSGLALEETPDGKLRLERVTRDMSGTYRCQTARYNGFNVRSREAQVQLNVQCESPSTPMRSFPVGSIAVPTSASPLVPFKPPGRRLPPPCSKTRQSVFSLLPLPSNAAPSLLTEMQPTKK